MKSVKTLFILLVTTCSLALYSQSKGTIKKNKIKSQTTEYTKVEDGVTIVKKEVEVYDDNGNVLEAATYINNKLEKKDTYKYNKNSDEIEHVSYNTDGTIKKTVSKKYNSSNDKTEEITYDGKGLVLKKEVTSYNNFGEKTSEITYDANGKLIEKSVYSYDNKGLKKERLTYDAENRLIGKKTYTFTFK